MRTRLTITFELPQLGVGRRDVRFALLRALDDACKEYLMNRNDADHGMAKSMRYTEWRYPRESPKWREEKAKLVHRRASLISALRDGRKEFTIVDED